MTPLPLVEELPRLCAPGQRALDIGAGTGRHAIFLAEHGFRVDALDHWAPHVGRLNAYARAQKLPLRAAVHDLHEGVPDCRGYGVVVCTLVLHHLSPRAAGELLRSARSGASAGTVHAIAAITSEGDFASELAAEERYFPVPSALESHYADAGWEVARSLEAEIVMAERHADGTPKRNVVSFVIARRLKA
jgi:tellurite methyltransferase